MYGLYSDVIVMKYDAIMPMCVATTIHYVAITDKCVATKMHYVATIDNCVATTGLHVQGFIEGGGPLPPTRQNLPPWKLWTNIA